MEATAPSLHQVTVLIGVGMALTLLALVTLIVKTLAERRVKVSHVH